MCSQIPRPCLRMGPIAHGVTGTGGIIMIVKQQSKRLSRMGNIAALVACLLPALLGMMGFAIDGGMLFSERRHAQSVADAAALAASCILFDNYQSIRASNNGRYNFNHATQSTARDAARSVAAANGYRNERTGAASTSDVHVRFPGNFIYEASIYNNTTTDSTNYDGEIADGCVEVTVTFYHPRYFTSIWGSDVIRITCRAVAKGAFIAPQNGVIVTNYTAGQSLRDTGGGQIDVHGGSFIVDSNANSAAFDQGGGVINVVG